MSLVGQNLEVDLGGVEVLDQGVPWLQDKLAEKVVWFRMLRLSGESRLSSIVTTKRVNYKLIYFHTLGVHFDTVNIYS